jgi:restriction system protein
VAIKPSVSAAEWERERRRQAREAERQVRADVAAAKATDRAAKEQHAADRKRLTEEQTRNVEVRHRHLMTLLRTGLKRSARIDLASLRRRPVAITFDAGPLAHPEPEPAWDQFSPAPAGPLSRMIGGKGRLEQQQMEARTAYEQAVQAWQKRESERQRLLAVGRADHRQRMDQAQAQINEHNRRLDRLATDAAARERKAVEAILDLALKRVPVPDDFPRRAEVTFNPTSNQVVARMQLPGRDVIPDVRAYKYIQVRDEVQTVPRPIKESSDIYRSVIAQVALLVLRDLFDADPLLTSIAFNGHVDAVDPGTGQSEYPCLISLNVDRETFEQLVLDQDQPEDCLRHLRAKVSPHPYE